MKVVWSIELCAVGGHRQNDVVNVGTVGAALNVLPVLILHDDYEDGAHGEQSCRRNIQADLNARGGIGGIWFGGRARSRTPERRLYRRIEDRNH